MMDRAMIEQAAKLLSAAVPQGSKVILFGSQARGTAGEDSDVDFLVVEPQVSGTMTEAARLYQALRTLRLAIDIVVLSQETFDYWKDTPNTLAWWVAREGKVLNAAS
jgi:predicted nucleotidyltransferase